MLPMTGNIDIFILLIGVLVLAGVPAYILSLIQDARRFKKEQEEDAKKNKER